MKTLKNDVLIMLHMLTKWIKHEVYTKAGFDSKV